MRRSYVNVARTVNLPELIAHTNMDNESVTTLKDALADFLKCVLGLRIASSAFSYCTDTWQRSTSACS